MMKRLLAALAIAALCVLGLASTAGAESYVAPFWSVTQLKWTMHNTGAKTSPGAYKDAQYVAANDNPWAVDSVSFNKTLASGATFAATEADTSRAFSTLHWTLPPSAPGLGGTSIDSTIVARVYLSDDGASATSIDSVYLAIQVSPDNKNWVYVNQILNVAGTNPLTGAGVENTFPILCASGTTTSTPKVFSLAFHTGAETGFYPYRYNWWQYPWARFIVVRKHVTGSAICNLKIAVGHWACETQGIDD